MKILSFILMAILSFTAMGSATRSLSGDDWKNPLRTKTWTPPAVSDTLLGTLSQLSGYVSGAGTVSATDTYLQAIQKLNGNNAINAAMTGEATSNGTTNAVTLTNSAVIGKLISGFVSGAGTVSATDSLLAAIQKLDGNDTLMFYKTKITTNADIAVATGASNIVRQGVGTNDTVLTADSTQTNGLKWAAPTFQFKGDYLGSAVKGSLLTAPYNQLTSLSATTTQLETGNPNVLVDPEFEAAATSWVSYNDGAVSIPVDGIGGTATVTAASNSGASPLNGSKSLLFIKTSGSAKGEGIALPFTIPTSSKYKVQRVQFDYAISTGAGTYTDDEVEMFVYDITNSKVIPLTPSKIKNHNMPSEPFNGEFQASDSTSYRLIAHVVGTSAAAYSLKFDSIKLGVYAKAFGGLGDDVYSAQGSSTGVISAENRDWIQGNASGTTSPYTLSFVTGTFSTAPNCWGNTAPSSSNFQAVQVYNISTTGAIVRVYNTNTGAVLDGSFSINCQKTGADYERAVSGRVLSSDADTRVIATTATNPTSPATFSTTFQTLSGFTVLTDESGSFNASTGVYTVKTPGYFKISGSIGINSATIAGEAQVLANGSTIYNGSSLGQAGINQWIPLAGLTKLVAGNTISIQVRVASGTPTSVTGSTVNIERVSGPAQIAASESVSAYYQGSPPTGTLTNAFNITTFGTKIKDSHNAYSGGTYTVPVSGVYDISAQALILSTLTANQNIIMSVYVDGVAKQNSLNSAEGSTGSKQVQLHVKSLPLLAGQLLTIRSYTEGTTNTFSAQAVYNFFSIVRTGNY